ncbi:MAG: DnaD domain protein [Bacillota bacterium]|nr:DnaD domain protein [Bacillota bacterium]
MFNRYEDQTSNFLALKFYRERKLRYKETISDEGARVLKELQNTYHFHYSVINVFCEYILEKTNIPFSVEAISPIAEEWQKEGISTVEQALEKSRK